MLFKKGSGINLKDTSPQTLFGALYINIPENVVEKQKYLSSTGASNGYLNIMEQLHTGGCYAKDSLVVEIENIHKKVAPPEANALIILGVLKFVVIFGEGVFHPEIIYKNGKLKYDIEGISQYIPYQILRSRNNKNDYYFVKETNSTNVVLTSLSSGECFSTGHNMDFVKNSKNTSAKLKQVTIMFNGTKMSMQLKQYLDLLKKEHFQEVRNNGKNKI